MARASPGRRRVYGRLAAPAVIVLILAAARGLLPWAAEAWVNRGLRDVAGYTARVEDVDLRVLRGGYTLEGVSLRKAGGEIPEPLFSADTVSASLEWRGGMGHPLTADMEVAGAEVHLVRGVDSARSQLGIGMDWRKALRRLSVVRVGRARMADGEVRFVDREASPDVDIRARDVDASVDNLAREDGAGSDHAAEVRAEGLTPGGGRFSLRLRLDPEARRPELRLDLSVDSLDLARTGGALEAYAGVDAAGGRLSMDMRATAAGGRFRGSLRPVLEDFDMGTPLGEDHGPLEALKEGVAEAAGEVAERITEPEGEGGDGPPEIPFSGAFPEEVQDVWSMSGYLMRESFDKALGTRGGRSHGNS